MNDNNNFGCNRSELSIRKTPLSCPAGCIQEDADQDRSVFLNHEEKTDELHSMEILAVYYKVGEMTNSIAMSEKYVAPTAQSLAGSAHLFAECDKFYKNSDVVFQIPQTLSPPLRPLEVFHSDLSRSSSLGSIGAFYNQVDAPIMHDNNDFGCKRSELPICNTPQPCPTGCIQEDAAPDRSVFLNYEEKNDELHSMEFQAEHLNVVELTNSIALSEQYVAPTAQSLAGSAHLFAERTNPEKTKHPNLDETVDALFEQSLPDKYFCEAGSIETAKTKIPGAKMDAVSTSDNRRHAVSAELRVWSTNHVVEDFSNLNDESAMTSNELAWANGTIAVATLNQCVTTEGEYTAKTEIEPLMDISTSYNNVRESEIAEGHLTDTASSIKASNAMSTHQTKSCLTASTSFHPEGRTEFKRRRTEKSKAITCHVCCKNLLIDDDVDFPSHRKLQCGMKSWQLMRNHCLQRHREYVPYEIAIKNDFINDCARSSTLVSAQDFEETLISYLTAVVLIQTFLSCDSESSTAREMSISVVPICSECRSYFTKWEMHANHKGMVLLRNAIARITCKDSSCLDTGICWSESEVVVISEIGKNSILRRSIIDKILWVITDLRSSISKQEFFNLCDEDFLSKKIQDSIYSGMKEVLDQSEFWRGRKTWVTSSRARFVRTIQLRLKGFAIMRQSR